MKKIALIVVVVAVVVYVFGIVLPDMKEARQAASPMVGVTNSEGQPDADGKGPGMGGPGGPGMGGPRVNPMDALKNEDGQIDLSKLADSDMPEEMKEALKGADADGDGLLSDEEHEAFRAKQREERRAHMFDSVKNDAGQVDLSKLDDARMFPQMKDAIKAADVDGDGVLSDEEFQALQADMDKMFQRGPGGPRGGAAPAPADAPAADAAPAPADAPAADAAPAPADAPAADAAPVEAPADAPVEAPAE